MSSLGSDNTMETIYFSFIHSHIIYGIYLYGSKKNENLNSIRTINFISLWTVYFQHYIIFLTNYFENILTEKCHPHNTRTKLRTTIPQHRLDFFRKRTSYMVINYLNFCYRLCNLKEELVLLVDEAVIVYFELPFA